MAIRCKVGSLAQGALVSLEGACSVAEAARYMAEQQTGSLVVTQGGEVWGLFTERDLLTRVVAAGLDPREVKLADVSTRRLVSIPADMACHEAIRVMRRHGCRRLVVYRGDSFSGLVRMEDLAHRLATGAGQHSFLVNALGGLTLMLAIGVIVMLLWQLPAVLDVAQRVSSG